MSREVLFGPASLVERMASLVGEELAGEPSPHATADAYVHVGQLYVSARPSSVTTILGSCVSVCLWDGAVGVGGLNHFLLPEVVENGQASPRFGNVAIQELIAGITDLGGRLPRLRAKVFGGASLMESTQPSGRTLGQQNVDLAGRLLREAGIPIVAQDVGGARGRKLLFQTGDGTAWVRLV